MRIKLNRMEKTHTQHRIESRHLNEKYLGLGFNDWSERNSVHMQCATEKPRKSIPTKLFRVQWVAALFKLQRQEKELDNNNKSQTGLIVTICLVSKLEFYCSTETKNWNKSQFVAHMVKWHREKRNKKKKEEEEEKYCRHGIIIMIIFMWFNELKFSISLVGFFIWFHILCWLFTIVAHLWHIYYSFITIFMISSKTKLIAYRMEECQNIIAFSWLKELAFWVRACIQCK